MDRGHNPAHSRTVLAGTVSVVGVYVSIALVLDDPLSVKIAVLGLMVSALVSAFALWLGLSPYRNKYADDPAGKRSRTLKRDAELVNSLWWDAVFYFAVWVALGIGAAFLLGNMNLLTAHQGALLGLFFLVTIPLIAVSKSGGTAHRHLKSAWVEPLAEVTRKVLVYGFCLFGLFVIYGTLNWYEGTWVELLRNKGGILFELGYVATLSTAIWFGFRATRQKVKTAWTAFDERQEVVKRANRKTNSNRAQARPKPKGAKARAKAKSRNTAEIKREKRRSILSLKRCLPVIEEKHLGREFDDHEAPRSIGPGNEYFERAVVALNEMRWKASIRQASKAMKLGLRGNTLATAHQITGDSLAELGDLPGSVDHYLSCLETASKGPSVTWQAAKRLSYIYEYADRLKEARKLYLLSEQANNALPFRVTHQFPVIDLFNQLARNYDSSLKGRNATPPPKHWPILSVKERDEQSVLHRMVRCPECNVRTKANQTTISTLGGECKSCGIVFSKEI